MLPPLRCAPPPRFALPPPPLTLLPPPCRHQAAANVALSRCPTIARHHAAAVALCVAAALRALHLLMANFGHPPHQGYVRLV
jgi:hypothetical protein